MNDDERILYEKVYDELNRCRDWPLKILGFTSGLYIAILVFLKAFSENIPITCIEKCLLILIITLFLIFCVRIIIKQHLEYLRYRNIQIALQKKWNVQEWKIEGKRIIPKQWDDELPVSIGTNSQGWLFYVFYIICLSAFSIFVICNL